MRRIFELMKSSELAPPEISSDPNSFVLALHHRPMYNRDEMLWLEQYQNLDLSSEEKAVLLIGRKGDLISPNDVIRRLGIVDTEHYRRVIHSLQEKGVLETALHKTKAKQIARQKGVGARDIPRFRVRLPKELVPRRPSAAEQSDVDDVGLESSEEIFVANIPPNTSERDLSFAFAHCGEIAAITIPKRKGLSRGFAFADFEKSEWAQRALGADIRLGGRKLVIRKKRP